MVLEIATLQVRAGQTADFERAFTTAQKIMASVQGYIKHELQRCLKDDHQYVLLMRWETLEHHTQGFRQSPHYQEWRALLHPFYDPFPTVLHYAAVVPVQS